MKADNNPAAREDLKQPTVAARALERTTQGITENLNRLIDRDIDPNTCLNNIVSLVEKEAQGRISDDAKEEIAKKINEVNISLIKKTRAENAKDTFFRYLGVIGTGMKYVGGALVALGAAEWLISAAGEAAGWCKDNIVNQIGKSDLGKKKAINATSNVICETVGIMSTAKQVLGITLTVGAALYAVGKKLETKDLGDKKMLPEEKAKYKEGLITDLRLLYIKEQKAVSARIDEIKKDLNAMDTDRLEKLKEAVRRNVEKFRAKHDEVKGEWVRRVEDSRHQPAVKGAIRD